LIDFYEEHRDHRDKFEIVAFHDATAKDFTELDKHLPGLREKFWRGRDLPFPILLDSTGKTIKAYDIHSFPTTLLIDPEGKLVGHASEDELEKKLPPTPIGPRIARALDRGQNLGFDDESIEQAAVFFTRVSRIDIHLDKPALAAAGIKIDAKVPLKVGGHLSLRSWLELALDPFELTYQPDEKGLLITTRKRGQGSTSGPSEFQRACAKRIEALLDKKISFNFQQIPLAELTEHLEAKTQENFVLDPVARLAKHLDPKTTVSGTAANIPLRAALKKLLDPVGLTFVVRDEVVIICPKERTAAR
jgi:AhpC/TSA family